MILVNGKPENRISVLDRGLQYGDGLFETIAFRNGISEFLDAHLQRLILGCERLSIPFKQLEQLRTELAIVYQQLGDDAVIKIIVTRSSGGRGYFADKNVEPTRIISTHPYPAYPQSYIHLGVTLRLCEQILSENKCLAGIKHLNRLEQVLARNEWDDPDIAEGLMCDNHGNVIEGTMSNVFIVKSGRLYTPDLSTSGVSGIIRGQIIMLTKETDLVVEECVISKQKLFSADEIFVCNSLIGIWPVRKIADTVYPVGAVTKRLQQALLQKQ